MRLAETPRSRVARFAPAAARPPPHLVQPVDRLKVTAAVLHGACQLLQALRKEARNRVRSARQPHSAAGGARRTQTAATVQTLAPALRGQRGGQRACSRAKQVPQAHIARALPLGSRARQRDIRRGAQRRRKRVREQRDASGRQRDEHACALPPRRVGCGFSRCGCHRAAGARMCSLARERAWEGRERVSSVRRTT